MRAIPLHPTFVIGVRRLTLGVRVFGAVALSLPTLLLLLCAYQRRWIADDAFIDLRIVANLLRGDGPVFNVGERVEAYTNPLWVALLALWGLTGARLEVGAVAMNLVLSAVGLIAAQAGAANLQRRLRPDTVPLCFVPAGALVLAALPPVWDFATSGLEMGLTFAWIGGCFWLLSLLPVSRRAQLGLAALVGLGPLIRPDLAIFGASFLVALAVCHGLGRGLLPLGFAAAVVPTVYQIFRMGYFAALLPNTALAKSAGGSNWGQGISYALDFVVSYLLIVPLAILGGVALAALRRAYGLRDRPACAVFAAPLVAGMLHACYIVRQGGDFMHGRLLLPGLFGFLAPVAVIALFPADRRIARFVPLVGLLAWAVPCLLLCRVPYAGGTSAYLIADERGIYARAANRANPVLIGDYAESAMGLDARALAAQAARSAGARTLLDSTPSCRPMTEQRVQSSCAAALAALPGPLPAAAWLDARTKLTVIRPNLGVVGYDVGPTVFVVDRLGLSDPLAARLQLTERGRPGHEKVLPDAWYAARFAAPSAADAAVPDIAAARRALGCGRLADLHAAVTEPLTPARFVANLRLAPSLTTLQIPVRPDDAVALFCR